MNTLKFCIFFALLCNFLTSSNAIEIKNIASVNNYSITNFDLLQEIKIKEALEKKKISKAQHSFVLQIMIQDKIKMLEIDKNKIQIPEQEIQSKLALVLDQSFKNEEISKSLKDLIYKKIKYTSSWNILISQKFANKLTVNMDEIDEIIKSQNLKDGERNKVIELEKNKKLNIFSKTYFNEIKKKYFIKKYL